MLDRIFDQAARHWRWIALAAWIGLAAWMIANAWSRIHGFALGDTDDNMRMSQVRALLGGQDWFDLRQYKLDPPHGANIHWSRLVDLPLAGLILLLRPWIGGADAERAAIAIAPLLPYLLLMFSLALTTRRLVDPRAYLAGDRRLVLRRFDQRHVRADADRPSRLAARADRAGGRRDRRSQARARRRDAGHGERSVADHRARDADLSRARRAWRRC